jgi:hypothetical protein
MDVKRISLGIRAKIILIVFQNMALRRQTESEARGSNRKLETTA